MQAARSYFGDSIAAGPGEALPSCPSLGKSLIPKHKSLGLFGSYLKGYYGAAGHCCVYTTQGQRRRRSPALVFQGDVPSSVLFCHTLHPALLITVAERCPSNLASSVRILAYADNVA
eukprot:309171-Hanusia_phi.AAC.1